MTDPYNKMLMRFKDVILIVTAISGLVIGLGKIFVLADMVNKEELEISQINPIVSTHTTQLAVITTQYEQIRIELERINRKLG